MPNGSSQTYLPDHLIAAAFAEAMACAREFEGATAPNPPVGCVLLDARGEIVAKAAHRRAGTAHAEAAAIAAARAEGSLDRIHTVVVTLEPCNHTGRTPPCTEAILATPAQAVWIGASDPNPRVAGGGGKRLAAAGLQVRAIGELADRRAIELAGAAERLIGPFAKHARTGRPWVTVKQALDRDGSMIPPAGQKTFTSAISLELAHRLRRRADAILTGSGTILADWPEFTVRLVADFAGKQRHLAILDRPGRVPQSYLDAAATRGFEVAIDPSIEAALDRLGRLGALEVLVEAGPAVVEAVKAAGLWDEMVIIQQGPPDAGDQVSVSRRAAPPDFGSEG